MIITNPWRLPAGTQLFRLTRMTPAFMPSALISLALSLHAALRRVADPMMPAKHGSRSKLQRLGNSSHHQAEMAPFFWLRILVLNPQVVCGFLTTQVPPGNSYIQKA